MKKIFCFVQIFFLWITFFGIYVSQNMYSTVDQTLHKVYGPDILNSRPKSLFVGDNSKSLVDGQNDRFSLEGNHFGTSGEMAVVSVNELLFLPDALAPNSLIENHYHDGSCDFVKEKKDPSCENDFIGIYAETFHDRDSSVLSNESAIVTRNVCFDSQKTFENGSTFKIISEMSTKPKIVHEADLGKIVEAWRSGL